MDVRDLFWHLIKYVVLLLWAGKALAGTIDPNTPDSQYVEFGQQFPFVVQIRNTIDCKKCNEVHTQIASAVIIRPHWILTAAHVVKDAQDNVVLKGGDEYRLSHLVYHKDYDEDTVGFHDIALAYSPRDFDLEFYTPLYRGQDEVGKTITFAGFGVAGTFLSGGKESDGKRRAGHNSIDRHDRAVLICSPSRTKRFPLEFSIAPGDSGGGMFIGNELAGINSFLMAEDKNPNGTYGDESAFTRVSLYVDWVDAQISKYEAALQGRATTEAELDLQAVE